MLPQCVCFVTAKAMKRNGLFLGLQPSLRSARILLKPPHLSVLLVVLQHSLKFALLQVQPLGHLQVHWYLRAAESEIREGLTFLHVTQFLGQSNALLDSHLMQAIVEACHGQMRPNRQAGLSANCSSGLRPQKRQLWQCDRSGCVALFSPLADSCLATLR